MFCVITVDSRRAAPPYSHERAMGRIRLRFDDLAHQLVGSS